MRTSLRWNAILSIIFVLLQRYDCAMEPIAMQYDVAIIVHSFFQTS
jgi:hypothetical protein